MGNRKMVLSATVGLGMALSLGLSAGAASAAPAGDSHASGTETVTAGFVGEQSAETEAFFKAVVKHALQKQADDPSAQLVTVTYDPSGAPSFASEISRSTSVWNSSVSNVQLQAGSNASFDYREGNDPRGSYASTDGHGNGYIFLDYAQNEVYYSPRVVTHETGHVLGLPDTYDGPCSQLMSGGGPGPSCTNDVPDSAERAQVEANWANGVASAAFDQAAFSAAD